VYSYLQSTLCSAVFEYTYFTFFRFEKNAFLRFFNWHVWNVAHIVSKSSVLSPRNDFTTFTLHFYRLLVIRPIWFFSVIITNCSRLNSLYIVCWCAVIKLLTVSLRWIKLTRVGFRAHVKINSIAYRIVSLTHSSRSWLLSGHVLFQKNETSLFTFSELLRLWSYDLMALYKSVYYYYYYYFVERWRRRCVSSSTVKFCVHVSSTPQSFSSLHCPAICSPTTPPTSTVSISLCK